MAGPVDSRVLKEYYVGSVGPLLYVDGATYPDTKPMKAFRGDQIHLNNAPSNPEDAVRLGDISIPTYGTWTPTLTNVANLIASTAFECQYVKIGSMVICSGKFEADPDVTLTLTRLGMSLPVAADFVAPVQCGGTAVCAEVAGLCARALADTTNNRAEFMWTHADIANRVMSFIFMYMIP